MPLSNRWMICLLGALWLAFVTSFSQASQSQTPFYFVAVAQVSSGKEEAYRKFVEQLTPVWERHGITAVLQAQIFDGRVNGDVRDTPSDITLLRVNSRAQFNDYLADPDYLRLKPARLDAVDQFLVLEADPVGDVVTTFLDKAPMVAVRFTTQKSTPKPLNITMEVFDRGPVKGGVSQFMQAVRYVQFQAVTFDDNPMQYFTAGPDASLGLMGNLLR